MIVKQVNFGSTEFYTDVFPIRKMVFCDEQHVSEENELDEFDGDALHYCLYDDDGAPIGVYRLLPPTNDNPGAYKLGRLAVPLAARNRGLGKIMMDHAEDVGRERGWQKLVVHAQTYVKRFYERLGFVLDESKGMWDEEGIDHIYMYKELTSA